MAGPDVKSEPSGGVIMRSGSNEGSLVPNRIFRWEGDHLGVEYTRSERYRLARPIGERDWPAIKEALNEGALQFHDENVRRDLLRELGVAVVS